MSEKKDMVVSLRRGSTMSELGAGDKTLAQFLASISNILIVDDLPSGETAGVRLSDVEFEWLKSRLGDKCHIVERAKGRVDI